MNAQYPQYNMSFVSFPRSLNAFLSILLDHLHDHNNTFTTGVSPYYNLSSSDYGFGIPIRHIFANPWMDITPAESSANPTTERNARYTLPFGIDIVSATAICLTILVIGYKVLPQAYARNIILSRPVLSHDWISTAGRLAEGPEIEDKHCDCCTYRSAPTVFYRLECLRCHGIDKVPILTDTMKLDNFIDDENLSGDTIWEEETYATIGDNISLLDEEESREDIVLDSHVPSRSPGRLERTELDYVFRDLCYHAS